MFKKKIFFKISSLGQTMSKKYLKKKYVTRFTGIMKQFKKECPAQAFSCNFSEILRNSFFYRFPPGDCFILKESYPDTYLFILSISLYKDSLKEPATVEIYPILNLFLRAKLPIFLSMSSWFIWGSDARNEAWLICIPGWFTYSGNKFAMNYKKGNYVIKTKIHSLIQYIIH